MAFPDPNTKYRIQSVILHTCIELVDHDSKWYPSPSVELKCVKDTEYQYWQFENAGKRKDRDVYYVRNVGNSERYLRRAPYAPAFHSGKASPYLGLVSVSYREGAYRLALYQDLGNANRFLDVHCNTRYPDAFYASDDTWDKENECKWLLVPVSDLPLIPMRLDPNVKFRIQSVDLEICIELVDGSSSGPNGLTDVRLRSPKGTDFQYWRFETAEVKEDTAYYCVRNVANSEQCLRLDNGVVCAGPASKVDGLAIVTLKGGEYGLAFHINQTNFDFHTPDTDNSHDIVYAKEPDNTAATKWHLAPVASQTTDTNLPGIYRIRSSDGKNLLTMPAKTAESKKIYIRSQLDQSPYQQWIVALERDGQYSIQSNGNQLYIGRSAAPAAAGHLVGSTEVCLWDIHSVGGFAWSFRIPGGNLSVGFADYEIDDKDEARLVSSDNTYSQIWFMEKSFPIGQDKVHAKRGVRDGVYFLRNAKDNYTYMNVSDNPWRIIPSSLTAAMFELKYVNQTSGRFTLALTDTNVELKVAVVTDGVEEHIGLNRKGTEFVLLEKDDGDPGYVICLSDSEHPPKVVSGRTTTDINQNLAFALDNKTAGESMQMWILVPGS
ncbi:hypothetical protein APHAL10511_000364 [Amanita phalloides]|nr:hypothetical protein APHAL10511_000364 [Amanita phalloides]